MSQTFKFPLSLQDESAKLDRTLALVGRLCFAADWDEECNAELVREIGLAINEYLRQRNALESLFGRVEYHDDEDFKAMVREFRRRLKR